MERFHCRGKREQIRRTEMIPGSPEWEGQMQSLTQFPMDKCTLLYYFDMCLFLHAGPLWQRRTNICIWKQLLITFFEQRILAKDKSTRKCSWKARGKQGKERERGKGAEEPPLQPKQLSVGTASCWRISEPRLMCKVIRNEAAGSDYHCDLGVHLSFDTKSVRVHSPPSLPPGRRSADSDPHKERSAVKGYLLIWRHGMKGGDTTSHHIRPWEQKPLKDCLKRLREIEENSQRPGKQWPWMQNDGK